MSDKSIDEALKTMEARATEPLGPRFSLSGIHTMSGEGDGRTYYFGKHRGAAYVAVHWRGFHGWSSSRWMPGGWEFYTPTLYWGRLGASVGGHRDFGRVLIPAKVVSAWRWTTSPAWRRLMREHPVEAEPAETKMERGDVTYCPECLEDVSLDGDYCDICGDRLVQREPPWLCPKCGHMIDTPQHELGCDAPTGKRDST